MLIVLLNGVHFTAMIFLQQWCKWGNPNCGLNAFHILACLATYMLGVKCNVVQAKHSDHKSITAELRILDQFENIA